MGTDRSTLKRVAWVAGALVIAILITLVMGNRSAIRLISKYALDGRSTEANVWTNDLADPQENFIRMQESIGGVPLTPNNRVEALIDGPATYAAMLEAIGEAKNHINLETYILESGIVGEQFADALIAKAKEGVQVNVLYDKFGSMGLKGEFIDRLTEAGINVHSFQGIFDLRFWRWNQRDHRKLLIVDGHIGFTGGINISDAYLHSPESIDPNDKAKGSAWHDVHAKVEGRSVHDMQRLFLTMWLNEGKVADASVVYFPDEIKVPRGARANAGIVAAGRLDAESRILESYVGAIQSARERIWITQAYFVPHYEMVQSLIDAAQRGVDVKVILPTISDSGVVRAASQGHFDTLISGGVQLYRYESSMLHAKTAVIDGLWSTIGSSNIDMRSLEHNNEANLIVVDREFAQKIETLFQSDLTQSKMIVLEQWRDRSVWEIATERFALLFAYWL